jgi:predicted small lipoprotein YifL
MHAAHSPGARSALVLAIALIALGLAGATLAGCGQKGQLYLPGSKKSKVPPAQQPQGTSPQDAPPAGTVPPA